MPGPGEYLFRDPTIPDISIFYLINKYIFTSLETPTVFPLFFYLLVSTKVIIAY